METMTTPSPIPLIDTKPFFLPLVLVEYAEEELLNGAIVALGQEKAYDKTSHRYLWKTMKDRDIPDKFMNTVKALYEKAKTQVVVASG
jgi:hypothetical protein